MMVTKKPDHQEERENKPLKPLRAGMPDDPAYLVVTTLVCFLFLHARLRVQLASGIPHALKVALAQSFGRSVLHNSGAVRGEKAEVWRFAQHMQSRRRPRKRAIQYSEALVIRRSASAYWILRFRGV